MSEEVKLDGGYVVRLFSFEDLRVEIIRVREDVPFSVFIYRDVVGVDGEVRSTKHLRNCDLAGVFCCWVGLLIILVS